MTPGLGFGGKNRAPKKDLKDQILKRGHDTLYSIPLLGVQKCPRGLKGKNFFGLGENMGVKCENLLEI